MKHTISELSVSSAIAALAEIGDSESSFELDNLIKGNSVIGETRLFELSDTQFDRAWKPTEHAYAYLDEKNATGNKIPLINAISSPVDLSLIGKRINLRIGNIYVERYPGILGGEHVVLFEFSAKHSPNNGKDNNEDIKYTQKYSIRNKGGSAKQGLSIFEGLSVPKNGIDFSLRTIHVENKSEEKVIKFLNSGIFNSGLELITKANPVLKQVAGYATGITEYLVEEKKNKVIQNISMGLDFSGSTEVASLSKGTYLAIQVDRSKFSFGDWYYDKDASIVRSSSSGERLPRNYISFVISEHI